MPIKYIIFATLKFFTIIFIVMGTVAVFVNAYFYVLKGRPPRIFNVEPKFEGKDLVVLPYTIKNYAGYGAVFEPEMDFKIKDAGGNFVTLTFLIDSGAVVSTLPYEYATTLGKNVENAQRIVLRGFGDKRTFGYMSSMDISVRNKNYNIPVVFSEGETSKKIIGRKGFFDAFTVIFDKKDSVIRLVE